MYQLIRSFLLVMLLAACESDPTPVMTPEPFMYAQVEEASAVTIEHNGPADFSRGTRSETEHARFIHSRDLDSENRIQFQLLSSAREAWEVGSFALEPRNFPGGNEGRTAHYRRGDEWYVSESGVLTITNVEADRVDGRFEFTAVFWCNHANDRDACLAVPSEYPADAPRLEIRGEFSAEDVGSIPVPLFGGGEG